MANFNSFVGLPWRERGRTREGVDCWGLAGLVYADHLGIELPSHSDDYSNAADREAIAALIGGGIGKWTRVEDDPRPYDLMLMRPWHVGIIVRRGLILHMREGHSSVIEQYTTARLQCRVEGIYRHASRIG